MTLLTAEEVAAFRADVDGERQVPGTIVRPRVVDDGAGGTMPDPAGPLAIPIVGTFSAAGGREVPTADQVQQRGSYRYRVAVDTDVQQTDQVALLGTIYTVVWAPPPTPTSLSRVIGLEEA